MQTMLLPNQLLFLLRRLSSSPQEHSRSALAGSDNLCTRAFARRTGMESVCGFMLHGKNENTLMRRTLQFLHPKRDLRCARRLMAFSFSSALLVALSPAEG